MVSLIQVLAVLTIQYSNHIMSSELYYFLHQ